MSATAPTQEAPARPTVQLPAIYDRAHDIAAFLREMGDAIYKSRMFGCETLAQGHVLALECAAKRLPPLALAERYHLIQGKLSMKAEAMLADFHTLCGGEHEIVERSPEKAAIKIGFEGKRKSYTFELTWQDALNEPFVYLGKESEVIVALAAGENGRRSLRLKPKYATPRARMQMLWARVVSDAVRAVAPEVVAGHYTPEEVSDLGGMETLPADEIVVDVEPEAAERSGNGKQGVDMAEIDRLNRQSEEQIAAAKVAEEKLVKEQPADVQHPNSPATAAATVVAGNERASVEQIAEARRLKTKLGITDDAFRKMLARAGAQRVSDLSVSYCNNLIDAMKREEAKRGGN